MTKLSDFTKKVLANIAEFNGGVLIKSTKAGKTSINTMSPSRDLYLSVEIPEQFQYDFVVSDLSRFLNIHSTITNPELDLHNSYAEIKSATDNVKIKYVYADPRAVIVPEGEPVVGDEIVSVDVTKETLDKIKRQSNILQLPHIQIDVENERLVCIAKDIDNPSSNTVVYDLGDANGIEIDEDVVVATEFLKIIPDDYQLTVYENAVEFKPLNNLSMTYTISRQLN